MGVILGVAVDGCNEDFAVAVINPILLGNLADLDEAPNFVSEGNDGISRLNLNPSLGVDQFPLRHRRLRLG